MSKYVKADMIVDRVCEGISCNECSFGTNEDGMSECVLDKRIAELPTADVVEVVRCKDCMHTEIDKYAPAECQNRCKLSQQYHEPTFFCKCGEPRTDLLEWIHRGDDE